MSAATIATAAPIPTLAGLPIGLPADLPADDLSALESLLSLTAAPSAPSAPSAAPLPLCGKSAAAAQPFPLPTAALALAAFFLNAAASLSRTFARLADPETEVDVKATCQAIHAYRMLVNVAKELDADPSQFVVTPSGGSSSLGVPTPSPSLRAKAPHGTNSAHQDLSSPSPDARLHGSAPQTPPSPSAVTCPLTPVTSVQASPPSPVRGPAPFVSTHRRRP